MQVGYQDFERTTALILASENWAKEYTQAPIQHAKLLRATARLERKLLVFFKEQAEHSSRYIDWFAYSRAMQEVRSSVQAYDVEVIVNHDVENDNGEFISIVFDEVATAITLGAEAGEHTYNIPVDLSAADSAIQRQARKQVSQLVGRRILDDGTVIDNPNAVYLISNTTRKRIQDAVHTSIMLGEDIPTATERIKKIIKDPKRARLIAQQEMANAYTSGLHMYGQASGAIGKEWRDNGAIDICKTNAQAGPLRFDKPYPSGHQHPTAHIGCKCYERLIYQNELDDDPRLFDR